MELREQILAVKGEYRAKTHDDGSPVPLVSNLGLHRGQCAFRHKKGDYYRFTVRALADVPPLLTHLRVADAETVLSGSRPDTARAARILGIEPEFRLQGEGIVYAALALWLGKNKIPVPPEYAARAIPLSRELSERLLRVRTDTLTCPLRIVDVGAVENGNTPVVPEDWLDREFPDGFALRKEIDTLPSRQLEAEATYCCHYGLHVLEESPWITREAVPIPEASGELPVFGIRIRWDKTAGKLESAIHPLRSRKEFESWLAGTDPGMRFRSHRGPDRACVWIACDRESLHNPVPAFDSTEPAGVLTSRVQKSIRRGRGAAALLQRSLLQLWSAPSHSLPEQSFLRTSASRQMAWRLFISLFEDAEPYEADPAGRYLSLPDLVALSVLAHADPDIQWCEPLRDLLIFTALLAQRNDAPGRNWDWRRGSRRAPITGASPLETASACALAAVPMMARDAEMLRQGCEYVRTAARAYPPLQLVSRAELLAAADAAVERETRIASADFHCIPRILLLLQGSLPFLPSDPDKHSTQALKRFIWENSSRISTRTEHRPKTDPESAAILGVLRSVQTQLVEKHAVGGAAESEHGNEASRTGRRSAPRVEEEGADPARLPGYAAKMRAGFLCLFGRTIYRTIGKSGVECLAAGTPAEPFKIKGKSGKGLEYLEDSEKDKPRLRIQRALLALLEHEGGLWVTRPQPPEGYRWKTGLPGKFQIEFLHDPHNADGVLFRAHGREVPAFDASPWLEPIPAAAVVPVEETGARWIRQALFVPAAPGEGWEDSWTLQERLRSEARALHGSGAGVPDWLRIAEAGPIPPKVWQRVLTRLHHGFENCVEIGPVDRNGDGQHTAIDPLYEGVFWRLFNLLAFLYPESVQPRGSLRFLLNRETPQYVHLLESVERLAFRAAASPRGANSSGAGDLPRIRTVLWDHQRATAERMVHGFLEEKRRGFGDASCVGAGKTLTALAVLCGLAAARREADAGAEGGEGFLVLVRDIPLVETWRVEIEKHCTGFRFVTQNASGVLSGELGGEAGGHSILVTTLARMRETPVHRRWNLVVIDECLAVQNAEALQTQEAWRQVLCARYGVLLLSATFFRSRFEKLFYLLKMLRTDLPETREYLDALLSESIVCNLPKDDGWRWTTHVNRIPLEPAVRTGYEAIRTESGRDAKSVYLALQKHLRGALNPAQMFHRVLEQRVRPGERALIFTASKEEADALVAAYPGEVGRFRPVAAPEDGKHIAASVAEAAHGVNHLVCCNVLVMRPPSPDLLPQMKGRLARPGQKQTELRIEYLLLEDTIEEADLIRLEEAARFHSQYIMPLADFYELAIRKRPVSGG